MESLVRIVIVFLLVHRGHMLNELLRRHSTLLVRQIRVRSVESEFGGPPGLFRCDRSGRFALLEFESSPTLYFKCRQFLL